MQTQQALVGFIRNLVEFLADEDCPEWWSPLFTFTRAVKGWYEEGVELDRAFDAVDRAMHLLGGWTILGLDEVPDAETAYECFTHAWGRVRFRGDEGPLEQALAKAKAYPLSTARERGRKMPKYDRFVSVAGWLQVTVGDRNILLPVRQVASLLKTVPCRVSIWRELAKKDGYLAEAKAHVFHGKLGVGRATEFRFDTQRWGCLQAAAASGCAAHFDFTQQHPPELAR